MKIIGYYHIRSETNHSDVLSKHWGHSQVWPLLQCVLFWKGDTADLIEVQEGKSEALVVTRSSHQHFSVTG
jgi:hypothetical protein